MQTIGLAAAIAFAAISESDLRQLSEDMELINLIEETEDAEQSTGEGC